MLDTATLPALVDELTDLNTQIAVLTARADQIKKDLASTGLDEVCGSVTRAVISHIAESSRPDWKAIAAKFEPTPEEIAAHQTTVAASSTCRRRFATGKHLNESPASRVRPCLVAIPATAAPYGLQQEIHHA